MVQVRNLKTLVMMQLKDKLDLSFVKTKRSLILKIALTVLKFVAITAIFFLLFYLSVMFSVFSFSRILPDTVVNLVFAVIQIMAIVSCTVGLSSSLFASADNRVLLTLPVSSTQIFISKLILFYIFELKRNISFTLPMFVAYGIVNHAVWYYYIWLLLCFMLISLVPVVIGAVLSIPAMYIGNFIRRVKILQFTLIGIAAGLVVWAIVALINKLPENINLLGQWGSISVQIQNFLKNFSRAVLPLYWLCLLAVGGSLRISSGLFGLDTLAYFGGTIGVIAVFLGLAYLLAHPLFFKMASRQFEYEKMKIPPKKNRKLPKLLSPFSESYRMELRSSRHIVLAIVELALPAVIILFLNKLYAAMNTSFMGAKLTQTFNILTMFVVMLSFNAPYSAVYSREANARNILKTRPENPISTLIARISSRMFVILVSTVAVIATYQQVAGETAANLTCLFFTVFCATMAHLLWCAEIDVMHSQADQYQTVGTDYDNPNERNATIIGMFIAALFTGMFYLFSDTGIAKSYFKIMCIAIVFLAARIYLYVKRVKLYFVEN